MIFRYSYRLILSVSVLVALAACGGSGDDHTDNHDASTTDSALHDFMIAEVQPVADGIWQNAGWIVTEDGEEELFPQSEAGWSEIVRRAGELQAIAAEIMTYPAAPEGRSWEAYSQDLAGAASTAAEAARRQDKQALFDAGGEIYRACLACHLRYARAETEGNG